MANPSFYLAQIVEMSKKVEHAQWIKSWLYQTQKHPCSVFSQTAFNEYYQFHKIASQSNKYKAEKGDGGKSTLICSFVLVPSSFINKIMIMPPNIVMLIRIELPKFRFTKLRLEVPQKPAEPATHNQCTRLTIPHS